MFLSLSNPSVYLLYQSILGAVRARRLAMDQYVKYSHGDRILDIGCGPGYVSKYFQGADYVGFDTEKAYIDYANRRYSRYGSFFCQEFDDAMVDKIESFNIVVMNGLLHHLPDDHCLKLLRRVKRILKENGTLVTLDCYRAENQSFFVREMLEKDRGKYIRQKEDYIKLASEVFDSVVVYIRDDLMFIPYPLVIMQIS